MIRLPTVPWLRRRRIAIAAWLIGLGIALAGAQLGAPESAGVGFGFSAPGADPPSHRTASQDHELVSATR